MGGFQPSLTFLNECVPLWFALVMGFTAPYMWSRYVKRAVSDLYGRYFGGNNEDT